MKSTEPRLIWCKWRTLTDWNHPSVSLVGIDTTLCTCKQHTHVWFQSLLWASNMRVLKKCVDPLVTCAAVVTLLLSAEPQIYVRSTHLSCLYLCEHPTHFAPSAQTWAGRRPRDGRTGWYTRRSNHIHTQTTSLCVTSGIKRKTPKQAPTDCY